MKEPVDQARADAARAALARVERESAGLFGSALRRAAEHFSAADAARDGVADDAAELWGRRVGRALAAMFILALVICLVVYGWA